MSSAPVSGRFSSAEEDAVARLLWSVDQAQTCEFFALEGPEAGLAEVRLRLPGNDATQQYGPLPLSELSLRPVTADAGRVLWIEAASAEGLVAWIDWLRTRRDSLREGGPRAIVLAAAKGLAELIAKRAPDLATVMQLPVRVGLPQQQRPATPVTWLHVSDLHLRATDWRQNVVLGHLVRDLPTLLSESVGAVDLLFCTGDISQSGRPEEFLAAQQALRELAGAANLSGDRLHVVPGNHDVDRRQINVSARLLQDALVSQAERHDLRDFEALLGDPDQVALLGARLGAYAAFTKQLLGVARSVDPSRPWRVDEYDISGLTIGVASLCSVLMAGQDGESGRLLLGERQVRDAAGELRRCQFKVALLHHPVDWLAEAERVAMAELLASEFQVVLHGHRHQPGTAAVSRGAAPSVTAAAGALYTSTEHRNQFQVGRFDPTTGHLDVHFFAYSPRAGGYWHVDSSVGRAAASGRQRVQLAALTAQAVPTGADSGLAERLCRAAVRVLEPVNFVGIPIAVHRPEARLEDIFIAQSLRLSAKAEAAAAVRRGKANANEWDQAMFAAVESLADIAFDELRIAMTTDKNHARFPGKRAVVVAGPGMGKSTLCQFLAYKAAQAGRVPLLLRLRDYLPQAAQVGLVEFAARRFTQHYSVPTSGDELRALAAEGRLAVFVDGFDEVAHESQRAEIRDAVVALAEQWPKVPMLCTTRPVGYDRAPLPRQFVHLELRQLETEQVDAFVERWYALALPNDAEGRRGRVADLQGALRRLPAARELASVPLLATLIALVHRYSATLPGSRARLMEKVIETLLDAWPAEQRRQFGELSIDQQRRLLERIALHSLGRVGKKHRKVTVDLAQAADIAAEDMASSRTALDYPEMRRLAERWLRWLVEGSGVLVEAAPQVLEFMHLSLGEYLAGQGVAAEQAAKDSGEVARELLTMSEQAELQQVGLYAAAIALGQRRDLAEALVEEARRAPSAEKWTQLLDLIQEGVITGESRVAAIVEGVLSEPETNPDLLQFHRKIGCFDAIIAHELPGHAALVQACCDYVRCATWSTVPEAFHVLGAVPQLARPCGQALAEAKDGAVAAMTRLSDPQWSLPTLSKLRAGEIAAFGPRLSPDHRRRIVQMSRGVVSGAPRVALPWLLADAQWQQCFYLRASTEGRLTVRGGYGEAVFVLEPPSAILAGGGVEYPGLVDRPRVWFGDGSENSPAVYGWNADIRDGRNSKAGVVEIRLADGAIEHAHWTADLTAGRSPRPTHPTLTSRELRGLAAYACAVAIDHSFWNIPLVQDRNWASNSYLSHNFLWTCLPHILTIGTWPTPDGSEPADLLPPQPPWAILYYYRLCQWALDPANDQRRQAVDAVIDSYEGPDLDLPPLLRQWRIVALGTPAYDAARAELLVKGEAALRKVSAKKPRGK